jgi:hypothetical protein
MHFHCVSFNGASSMSGQNPAAAAAAGPAGPHSTDDLQLSNVAASAAGVDAGAAAGDHPAYNSELHTATASLRSADFAVTEDQEMSSHQKQEDDEYPGSCCRQCLQGLAAQQEQQQSASSSSAGTPRVRQSAAEDADSSCWFKQKQRQQQSASSSGAGTPRTRLSAAEDADGSCLFSTPRRGERRLLSQHRAGLKGQAHLALHRAAGAAEAATGQVVENVDAEAYHACSRAAAAAEAEEEAYLICGGVAVGPDAGVNAAGVKAPGVNTVGEGATGLHAVATIGVAVGVEEVESAAADISSSSSSNSSVILPASRALAAAGTAEGNIVGLLQLPSGDDVCWLTGAAEAEAASYSFAGQTGSPIITTKPADLDGSVVQRVVPREARALMEAGSPATGTSAVAAAAAAAGAVDEAGLPAELLPLPSYEEACQLAAPEEPGIMDDVDLAGDLQDPKAAAPAQQQPETSCQLQQQQKVTLSNDAAAETDHDNSSSSSSYVVQPRHRPTLSCDMPSNNNNSLLVSHTFRHRHRASLRRKL